MSDYLPPEILFQILRHLPAKTLGRFLTVSKSCHSRITSKDFISSHLIQPPNPKNHIFHVLEHFNVHTKPKYPFHLLAETQNQETQSQGSNANLGVSCQIIYPPMVGARSYNRIVGIENGLILLIDDFSENQLDLLLWNPAVDVFVRLPRLKSELMANGHYALGFWFDSRNCDFMVMRIAYRTNVEMEGGYDQTPVAEVCSLNMGEWIGVKVDGVKCYLPSGAWSHVYLNGRSHWIGYRNRHDPYLCLIMSFDMNDGVFREIMLPLHCHTMMPYDLKVTERMGCLAVIGDGRASGVCRIWVMKKYGDLSSWTNLCNIPIHIGLNHHRFLGFCKNGDVLLIRNSCQLIRYVPGSESFLDLDIALGRLSALGYAGKYEESLALFDLKSSDK